MLTFVEERLDMGYDYGSMGGPGFSTNVVVSAGGGEFRNSNWSNALGRWQLGEREIVKTKLDMLVAFFRARRGKAVGFRYKDWSDYTSTDQALVPDGTPTVQLQKTYQSATVGENEIRDIKKPVAGTITLKRGGAAFAAWTLDDTTGLVALTADWSANVQGVTQTNPAVVNITGHGRTTGDVVYLAALGGMTELNAAAYTIAVIDADHFSLNGVNATGYTAYTSGGTAAMYVQPSETLTWSGEFDVPARFDVDHFQARFDAYDDAFGGGQYYLTSLPVQEIRL